MFRTEPEFVRWLVRMTPGQPRDLRLGIGDDAALVKFSPGKELILTIDMSIEGVHFLRTLHPPRAVGHRALARSLSDIAAMGGTPRYALVSLAVARGVSEKWIKEFYEGFLALARRFGVTLIGGDTARVARGTMADIVVAGEVPRGQGLRRSGAKPGDRVYVSGTLGLAALGLQLLKSQARGPEVSAPAAIRAHLYPEPQCALGRFLAERHLASSLMDISDGLSSDLARLCEASGVGATVWSEEVPRPPGLKASDSLRLALHGGEDYQLLFAVPREKAARVPTRFRGVTLHAIGEFERREGVCLALPDGTRQPLLPSGWDYFRG